MTGWMALHAICCSLGMMDGECKQRTKVRHISKPLHKLALSEL